MSCNISQSDKKINDGLPISLFTTTRITPLTTPRENVKKMMEN
jgi:hypothetical protein